MRSALDRVAEKDADALDAANAVRFGSQPPEPAEAYLAFALLQVYQSRINARLGESCGAAHDGWVGWLSILARPTSVR